MANTQNKKVFSIYMSRKVLNDIRASGVRNLSRYFEELSKADLYQQKNLSKEDQEKVQRLSERLHALRAEWKAFEKNEKKVTA
jgi:hypothetical protein